MGISSARKGAGNELDWSRALEFATRRGKWASLGDPKPGAGARPAGHDSAYAKSLLRDRMGV